jgi:hypothetical protein
VHVDQLGELYDVPITVAVSSGDKKDVQAILPVTERSADFAVPLHGALRGVDVSRDDGSLFDIVKN